MKFCLKHTYDTNKSMYIMKSFVSIEDAEKWVSEHKNYSLLYEEVKLNTNDTKNTIIGFV